MNVREYFSDWNHPSLALYSVARQLGYNPKTVKEMLTEFGNLQITGVREEQVSDENDGFRTEYVLTINGKEVRVF